MQNFSWAILAFEVMGPSVSTEATRPACLLSPRVHAGVWLLRATFRVNRVPLLQEGFLEDYGLSPSEDQASGPWTALGSKDSCFAGWWAVSGELAVLAIWAP